MKPIQTVMPRRKRLRSGIASSASQRLAVHQAEVAGLDGEVEAREAAEGAVEAARGDALEGGLPQPLLAHGVDDVDALAPALEHLRDHLRRVLQVAVEHHDHVAAGVLEPGGQRRLVAEVARERDDLHARVARGGGAPSRRACGPWSRR